MGFRIFFRSREIFLLETCLRLCPFRDCHRGNNFLLVRARVGHLTLLHAVPSGTISSVFSATTELDCKGSSEALELPCGGGKSPACELCSANSLSSASLVSSTLSIRVLVFFLLLGIVRNNRNESFWNFVLIQRELDKGPF